MNKKSRLGRGFASIFNSQQDNTSNITQRIDIKSITKNPFQPRNNISEKELKELSDSIKEYGLIQAITVRKIHEDQYELISGERRLRASMVAGLKKIPVFIKNIQNDQMLELALVENIQRQDLDPIEIALSLQQLLEEKHITQEGLGKKIGKSRSTISNYIRLLKLDPIIQAGIRDKIITMGHAKAIINIMDKEIQLELYKDIIQNNYSVREIEIIVQKNKLNRYDNKKKRNQVLSSYFQKIENNLSDFFNQKVHLKIAKNGKGKIEILFESERKLDEIIQILQS